MFFPLFWRGSGGNPQITSAQDRGVSWRPPCRATRKIHYFLSSPGAPRRAAAGRRFRAETLKLPAPRTVAPVGVSWRRLVRATRKIHYFLVLPGGASAGCRGPPLSGGHPLITSSGAPLIALPLGEGGEHGNARSHGEGTDVSSSQYGLCVCVEPVVRCHLGQRITRAQQQEGEHPPTNARLHQRCSSSDAAARRFVRSTQNMPCGAILRRSATIWCHFAAYCHDLPEKQRGGRE